MEGPIIGALASMDFDKLNNMFGFIDEMDLKTNLSRAI